MINYINSDTLVVFDGTAACYKAAFSYPLLSIPGGERTEIYYGFFINLLNTCNYLKSSNVCFVWDSPDNAVARRKIYPEYKQKRKEKDVSDVIDEHTFKQMNNLSTNILPKLGFKNIFMQSEREADDLIAVICNKYKNIYNKIAIISNDKDLYQLLDDNVYMCNVKAQNKLYAQTYTKKDFVNEWEISPECWGQVKAIAGCPTDNVEGISGVGEKTAVKFLKGELKETTKAYKKIEEGLSIILRNYSLVVLPFKDTNDITVKVQKSFDVINFLHLFDKYQFGSFVQGQMWLTWQKVFQLD